MMSSTHAGTKLARGLRAAMISAAAVACVAPIGAQELPLARAVLARYAEATGAAKLQSVQGYHVTGTFEVVAQGLRGTMEGWRDIRSGRSAQILTLPGLGDIRTGSDSAFAWSISPFEGPKILEAKEFIELREKEDLRTMRRDPSVVIDAFAVERALVDSQPCVILQLKWLSGRETKECYSDSTGLLLRVESVETTSAGAIPTTTFFSEYTKFGDVTLPAKSVQRAAMLEVTQRTTNVEFVAVDSVKVMPPAEILALRKR